MIDRIGGRRPARLYIEEWMATIPGLDRKRLAERMGVAGGTITKKLQDPQKIDAEWLQRFADALNLQEVTDLFRDPAAPTPADLLRGLSEQQQREVIDFAAYVRLKTGTEG
ncbi:MAG TPA: helix-turn-helix transcriptional regulator [Devosia sp.]|nr:helix-turn-helix transcriptional regulator [Devosia sp.]